MTQLKTVISEELHRKIKKISTYTATSISAASTYLAARQIKAYHQNPKDYTYMWSRKHHVSMNNSPNNKSLSVYTTEILRSYFETMYKELNEKSGILLKELVRLGTEELQERSKNKNKETHFNQMPDGEKFKKHVIKYSLSNCLYGKVNEIAETIGISVSALTSFIVTEYLIEHYPEFAKGTEKEGLSVWDMLEL